MYCDRVFGGKDGWLCEYGSDNSRDVSPQKHGQHASTNSIMTRHGEFQHHDPMSRALGDHGRITGGTVPQVADVDAGLWDGIPGAIRS